MVKISMILPCLNEEKSIGFVINKTQEVFRKNKVNGEIIVVDNGSTDNSAEIAKKYNIRYFFEGKRGYGNAYLKGFKEAKGSYIIMMDSDGTYDPTEIPYIIEKLDQGYDVVIGSRFKGNIKKETMPFSHRYLGIPLMNYLIRLFFSKRISDSHSGFRGLRKSVIEKLNLKTKGMEFASEMIIKSIKKNFKIAEIPITYSKRTGKTKLKTFNDGWKHIRFIFLYSPNYLFIFPGLFLFLLGWIIMLPLLLGIVTLFGFNFQNHPMLLGSALTVLGYQILLLGVFAKIYAHNNLDEKSIFIENLFKFFNLERIIFISIFLLFSGIFIYAFILFNWISKNFGNLETINLGIFALTLIIISIQTIFSGFFMSFLGIEK